MKISHTKFMGMLMIYIHIRIHVSLQWLTGCRYQKENRLKYGFRVAAKLNICHHTQFHGHLLNDINIIST